MCFVVIISDSFLDDAKMKGKRGPSLCLIFSQYVAGASVTAVEYLLDVLEAVYWNLVSNTSLSVNLRLGSCLGSFQSLYLLSEIEMVIMERSKLPELAASTSMQEQNTTDEEKSAATGLESVQWSR